VAALAVVDGVTVVAAGVPPPDALAEAAEAAARVCASSCCAGDGRLDGFRAAGVLAAARSAACSGFIEEK
jgi:hypothetical protein